MYIFIYGSIYLTISKLKSGTCGNATGATGLQ